MKSKLESHKRDLLIYKNWATEPLRVCVVLYF